MQGEPDDIQLYIYSHAYDRIQRWLERYAPATAATIRSPANDRDISSAVATTAPGFELYRELWLARDGVEPSSDVSFTFPGGYRPLPLNEAVAHAQGAPAGWLPVAARTPDDILLVDCGRSHAGHLLAGSVVVKDLTLIDLYRRVSQLLDAPTVWRGWAPALDGGRFRWVDLRAGESVSEKDAKAIAAARSTGR